MRWKSTACLGFPNYRVSEFGDCENINGKRIAVDYNLRGYIRYRLSHKGIVKAMFAHRLVALLFIPNPLGKPQVNHYDENIHNNDMGNLEWVTDAENKLHSRNRSREQLKKDCPF